MFKKLRDTYIFRLHMPITKISEVPIKANDLTGWRSGRLTIVKVDSKVIHPKKARTIYWLAQCDCGNRTIVAGNSFINGHAKSCGCLSWDVNAKVFKDRDRHADAAAPRQISAKEVLTSNFNIPDLIDKKFGRLTASDIAFGSIYSCKQHNRINIHYKLLTYWNCTCDCGNTVVRSHRYLVTTGGTKQSCGCIRRLIKPPKQELFDEPFFRKK